MQLAISATYAAAIVVALAEPASLAHRWKGRWDRLLAPFMTPILEAVGPLHCVQGDPVRSADQLATYVQLVAFNLAVASCVFVASVRYAGAWGRQLLATRWAATPPEQRESELEIGEGVALAGAFVTAGFLVAGAPEAVAEVCPTFSLWPYLRVPLIVTVVYGLCCFVAAFFAARSPPEAAGGPGR